LDDGRGFACGGDPLKPLGKLFDVGHGFHVPGAPSTGSDEKVGSQGSSVVQTQALHERPTVESVAHREPGDAAERAALVAAGLTGLLELLRIERPPLGCGEHSVDPPVPLTPPARKPGEPLVGRTQADPGLVLQGAY